MKWISNDYTKSVVEKFNFLIPKDFDYKTYISMHSDLINCAVNNEQKAKEHYLMFGIKEGRSYKRIHEITKQKNTTEFWNNNKNLLYFSPMAPDYDVSSGGNRLLQILSILKLDLGYNIWFLCNGFNKINHIDAVKNIDIPVFLPDLDSQKYLDYHLKQAKLNNIKFDNAIFSWYDIGNQYIDIVKSIFPDIKIIVDSVDVHWVREQRGKDAGKLNISQENIEIRKNIEKTVYKKADVIFAVTEKDKKYIQQEIGYESNIKILSNIHEEKQISLGYNIFFIGNYDHKPNVDAVQSCIKIYKLFQQTPTFNKLRKKPKMLIVGPNLNSEIQKEIAHDPFIKYLGHIENINDLYVDCCLLISPLSWGAGIKGKICDAAASGIPILTSEIGNEGIGFTNKTNALIANEIEEFVCALVSFFSLSKNEKNKLGQSGKKHLSKIISRKAATNVLSHSLQDKHVVISIVTYNQKEKLDKCIGKILELTIYKNYTICISDNSESDEIRSLIFKKYSKYIKKGKIKYKKNKNNDYFIKPNNKIFGKKEYKNSDFVLMNDDVEIIDGNWLNHLYSSAYSADYIAAAGGKTLYPNGLLAEAGAELYSDGSGRNIGRNEDANLYQYNKIKYVGYCSGCFLYMRHDAIDQVGPFSENLEKMYYEDSEWQYRCHVEGLKTIYDHRSCAVHNEGSSAGTDCNTGAKKYQKINQKIFLENMKKLQVNNIEIFNNEE